MFHPPLATRQTIASFPGLSSLFVLQVWERARSGGGGGGGGKPGNEARLYTFPDLKVVSFPDVRSTVTTVLSGIGGPKSV